VGLLILFSRQFVKIQWNSKCTL